VDVILIRHAVAIDETLELSDPMRMLTSDGRTQARRLGERLHAKGCQPSVVWTSPLVRAVQTAEIVIAALGVQIAVEVSPCLAPDDSPKPLIALLRTLPATACPLVIGHEPNLSALGSLLVNDPGFPALAKAEAVRITDGKVRWRVVWSDAAPISTPSLN
jgi:phosphohistidine phosphatase